MTTRTHNAGEDRRGLTEMFQAMDRGTPPAEFDHASASLAHMTRVGIHHRKAVARLPKVAA